MVVTGKEFNRALAEINGSYSVMQQRLEGLLTRVSELEKIVAETPAGKKAKAAKEVPVDEAALANIADR